MPPAAVHYFGRVPRRPIAPPPLSRVVTPRLNAFSLACLRFASPHESIATWRAELDVLCARYSQRAVTVRLDHLHARGYLTDGCPRHGYLTDKGRAALALVD